MQQSKTRRFVWSPFCQNFGHDCDPNDVRPRYYGTPACLQSGGGSIRRESAQLRFQILLCFPAWRQVASYVWSGGGRLPRRKSGQGKRLPRRKSAPWVRLVRGGQRPRRMSGQGGVVVPAVKLVKGGAFLSVSLPLGLAWPPYGSAGRPTAGLHALEPAWSPAGACLRRSGACLRPCWALPVPP